MLVPLSANKSENVQEEIEDVQVEIDGSMDVFLRSDFSHDHVGVKDDEEGKEKGSSTSNEDIKELTLQEHL